MAKDSFSLILMSPPPPNYCASANYPTSANYPASAYYSASDNYSASAYYSASANYPASADDEWSTELVEEELLVDLIKKLSSPSPTHKAVADLLSTVGKNKSK